MATAATRTSRRAGPSPKQLAARRAVARQRLDLEIALKGPYAEMARLDADLKKFATDGGESFKEDFGADGYVQASGAVAAEFKGEVPEIQTEAWQELPKAERARLIKSGLIKMVEQYGRATNGKVTVKAL